MIIWNEDDPLALSGGRFEAWSETKRANRALADYAKMGAARSLRSLCEIYLQQAEKIRALEGTEVKFTRPPTTKLDTLFAWSSRFEWVARVERYDELKKAQEDREFEEERRQDRLNRIKILRAYRSHVITAISNFNPAATSWSDLTAALRMLSEELRREYGEDAVSVKVEMAPKGGQNLTDLPDEELQRILRGLIQAGVAAGIADHPGNGQEETGDDGPAGVDDSESGDA